MYIIKNVYSFDTCAHIRVINKTINFKVLSQNSLTKSSILRLF